MKIAWYTPFSDCSAIGAFSAQVVAALQAMDVAVTVVRSEMQDEGATSAAQIATNCPVFWAHHWHRDLEQRARDFDLFIYNIGDHFPFHAYCMAHLPRVPGVVILHDYHVHHLLAGCATWDEITLPPYAHMLGRDHGQEAVDSLAEAVAEGRYGEWIRTEQPQYPIISDPFEPALGVVAHAEYYRGPCADRLGVPTATIPLAYRGIFDGRTHPVPQARPRRRLITFGNVNSNKCYPTIIRALGHDARLAAQWEYRIVGDYVADYRYALEELVRQQPHAVELTFTGRVTNDHLAQELRNADAIACLRHPVLEGASASVIEALQAARPVLVNDIGCYAEIPRECAYHVNPGGNETAMIQRHLRDIHDAPEQAAQKARLASGWAIARHDNSRYAERLIAFMDEVLRERPVLELVDHIMQYAAQWSMDSSQSLARALETHIHTLFPQSVTKPLDSSGK